MATTRSWHAVANQEVNTLRYASAAHASKSSSRQSTIRPYSHFGYPLKYGLLEDFIGGSVLIDQKLRSYKPANIWIVTFEVGAPVPKNNTIFSTEFS